MKDRFRITITVLVLSILIAIFGFVIQRVNAQTRIEECGDPFTPIYDIQGSGFTSPLVGNLISTEGFVVGDFQDGGKDGFYIQDPTGDGQLNTSDGIFIFAESGLVVEEGHYVRVNGTVSEYFDLTEITANEILLCETGFMPPEPTELILPVANELDFEKLEGMLVTIPQNLVISEYFNYDRYGEIVLSTERFMTFTAINEPDVDDYSDSIENYFLNSITLDDGRTDQNPDPVVHPNGLEFTLENRFRGGDLVAGVTGILDYAFSIYRIQPTEYGDYTAVNDRPETYSLTESDMKVASFNVLNYFTTLTSEGNICGPSGDMECRGADTAEEFTRQRAKIIAAMSEIDADIFGLMEIENDRPGPPPDYAVADLVSGLNDLMGAGTYDLIPTGSIGTDAIKVALIYKPGEVTPVGDYQVLDSSVDPRFVDTKNRPTLAQTFLDVSTGESVTVAVNHLKSKGSPCAGDPDLNDGAGNCNITRRDAAEAMVDWLANETYFPGVENLLIIGDLNSYDKEDPIDAIKEGADDTLTTGDDYVDLIYQILGEEAYGYVFDGKIGYLDYAMANKILEDNVKDVTIWHINADEPDLIDYDMSFKQPAQDALYAPDAYRSSDHDPVIITLSFPVPPIADDDNYGVLVDTQLVVSEEEGVLANDFDGNGDLITAELIDDISPANAGTLIFQNNGSFTFTPEISFEGEAMFTYKASDGVLQSDIAAVKIKVTNPPIAEDNSYSTDEDVTLSITALGVLGNDTDINGDSLTAVLESDVSNGTLALLPDGSFTYSPDHNYNGSDSFTYKAYDGGLYSETALVTITINPVNDPPVAVEDVYEIDEDASLEISAPGVLLNDSDPEGDSMTAVLETDVSNGLLTLLSDGSFTYTPDPNYNGINSFIYSAYDGFLYSEAVEVIININPVDEYIFLPIILN